MAFYKKIFLFFLLTLSVSIYYFQNMSEFSQSPKFIQKTEPSLAPKNIILFIGDGMGPSYMKAYQRFRDNPKTAELEETLFDSMFVGILSTEPALPLSAVTDSAAAATAMATGIKTKVGSIGLDINGQSLLTILEAAKQKGLSTGLVVTTNVSDATPASFASHQNSRKNEEAIIRDYIDRRYQQLPYIDVLMGGGAGVFVQDGRNIINEFKQLGYQYVEDREALKKNNSPQLLGLFSAGALEKMIDRKLTTPSLAEMTRAAIKQLSKNEQGFFLMVEGSQIDWAGHYQDIVSVMSEMQDFEAAVLVAKEFADSNFLNKETQIIVTADHSTGGLSVGNEIGDALHPEWNASIIQKVKYSPKIILEKALRSQDIENEFYLATGLKLTEQEMKNINALNITDYYLKGDHLTPHQQKELHRIFSYLCQIISERSYTGWTTHAHTGEDVFLYAYGPVSKQLQGRWENTKIAQLIFQWLN